MRQDVRLAWIWGRIVLFAALMSAERPAIARAPAATPAPTAAATRAGRGSPQEAAALEQASRAIEAGRLEEAAGALEQAYQLSGDPELLFRLGELTSRMQQDARALRLYRTYLARAPGGPNRAAAERQIALLQAGPSAQAASKSNSNSNSGSESGLKSESGFKSAAAASPGTASAAPVVATGAGPSLGGRQPVTSTPWPTAPDPAAATPASDASTAPPGLTAVATPPTEPPIPRWVPWAGLTVTVGLAVAATISGLSASDRYDQLRGSCGATSAGCSQAQIDDVRSSANRTTGLWVAAGILAAATGAGFYVNTRQAGFSGVWRF